MLMLTVKSGVLLCNEILFTEINFLFTINKRFSEFIAPDRDMGDNGARRRFF